MPHGERPADDSIKSPHHRVQKISIFREAQTMTESNVSINVVDAYEPLISGITFSKSVLQ